MGLIDALFTGIVSAQRITQRIFKRSQMLPKTLQKNANFTNRIENFSQITYIK